MEHHSLGITVCQVLLWFSFLLNKTGISLFYISTSCSPLSELSDTCLPVWGCYGSGSPLGTAGRLSTGTCAGRSIYHTQAFPPGGVEAPQGDASARFPEYLVVEMIRATFSSAVACLPDTSFMP